MSKFDPSYYDWPTIRNILINEGISIVENDQIWDAILARHFALRRFDLRPPHKGLIDNMYHERCDCIKVVTEQLALDSCDTIQTRQAAPSCSEQKLVRRES